MKKIVLLSLSIFFIISCNKKEKSDVGMKLEYPKTEKIDSVRTYFETEINDHFGWLEDDESEKTKEWVKAENKLTYSYLDQIPYRKNIQERLEKIWNYEKITAPFEKGDDTYFYKNDGLQNHNVLYRKGEKNDEIFLDPNTFSKDGTTSLSGISFTEDGKLAAYLISEGGSDWRKAIVINTKTKEVTEDTLINIKFSGISWYKNEGFYYSSYDKPKGSELSAKTDQHKIYYHKLNTPQSSDKVVFGGTPEQKYRYAMCSVPKGGEFLVISAAIETTGNKLFIKDLSKTNSPLKAIVDNTESSTTVVKVIENKLFLKTNLNAPNGKIVTVDASNPTPENWVDLIPETNHVLSIGKGGNYIFAKYMIDAISSVIQYDYNGNKIREVKLPGIGSISGFNGKKEDENIYYSFSNYKTPSSIYTYSVKTGKSELFWRPKINFKSDDYESNQIFYTSKDGTKVPMIITHKKGVKLDGTNPTLLYGYGGFNASITPTFSLTKAIWMEMGGIYAVANIRGGGEYGRSWHDAGIQQKKQNVFDDFIAAGEYLIENKYTSSDYLAVLGHSNGGLLIGATMTQRPDLMKVALPSVGVLDMLRYHTFTAGAGWSYDYGTAEQSKKMFNYLLNYSPVHNVKKGTEYPATMVITGDHDDRVVPAHSFKFAAELQDKQTGENPVLIRVEVNAGHGAGKPAHKIISEWADIYGFTLYNMGFKEIPN